MSCLGLLCHTMADLDPDELLATIKEIILWKCFSKESTLSFRSTEDCTQERECEENVRSVWSVYTLLIGWWYS